MSSLAKWIIIPAVFVVGLVASSNRADAGDYIVGYGAYDYGYGISYPVYPQYQGSTVIYYSTPGSHLYYGRTVLPGPYIYQAPVRTYYNSRYLGRRLR